MEGVRFREAFNRIIREERFEEPLRSASLSGRLGTWTTKLTALVVASCESLGWHASAKSHRLELLPEPRSEYLGMDVMAFSGEGKRWRFPLAVIELENQASADRIGYSLWKVLCVRAPLRIVFCYRKEQAEVSALMSDLSRHVIASLALTERADLEGETLVIVGSRGNADTFPYGFFHWWELNRSTGKFERI
jgi:hypothetical protein